MKNLINTEKIIDLLRSELNKQNTDLLYIKKTLEESKNASYSYKFPKEIYNWNFGFIGTYPLSHEDILSLTKKNRKFQLRTISNIDTIILGRDFNENELSKIVSLKRLKRIFTQEHFINYLLFNRVDFLDVYQNLINHQAINYLKELSTHNFIWPEVFEVEKKKISNNDNELNLEPKSLIMERYKYSVKKGVSRNTRRLALESCVKDRDIGLEYLAKNHIFGLIKSRQRIDNQQRLKGKRPRNSDAIEKWKDDLSWLKEKFYKRNLKFKWPIP